MKPHPQNGPYLYLGRCLPIRYLCMVTRVWQVTEAKVTLTAVWLVRNSINRDYNFHSNIFGIWVLLPIIFSPAAERKWIVHSWDPIQRNWYIPIGVLCSEKLMRDSFLQLESLRAVKGWRLPEQLPRLREFRASQPCVGPSRQVRLGSKVRDRRTPTKCLSTKDSIQPAFLR